MTRVEITGSVPRFPRRAIAAFARKVLQAVETLGGADLGVSGLSIAFVDDEAMRALNRRFRRKNRTTDVLTFPADESYADPSATGRPLGDIVISLEQARRQAADEKHALATEIRYLILHGIIHAHGYDHESDHGEMNALELRVRQRVGLE